MTPKDLVTTKVFTNSKTKPGGLSKKPGKKSASVAMRGINLSGPIAASGIAELAKAL
jgi:hypothetical protein